MSHTNILVAVLVPLVAATAWCSSVGGKNAQGPTVALPDAPRVESRADEDLSAQAANPVRALYRETRGEAEYRAPTGAETAELCALAQEVVRAAVTAAPALLPPLKARAAGLRMQVTVLELPSGSVLALTEHPQHRRGWGAYLFRMGPLENEVVVQAPHTFYDQGTGAIALTFFDALPIRALFFNTVHRGRGRVEKDHGELPTDVAHNPGHPFQCLTNGLETLPRVQVIQLHGFGAQQGSDEISIVLSTGRRGPAAPSLSPLAERLETLYPGVRRYPDEVRRLGGTTNVQARRVNGWPGATFLHVELSSRVRAHLVDSRAARLRFVHALLGSTAPALMPEEN